MVKKNRIFGWFGAYVGSFENIDIGNNGLTFNTQ